MAKRDRMVFAVLHHVGLCVLYVCSVSMHGSEAGRETVHVQWHAHVGREALLPFPWAHMPGVLRGVADLAHASVELPSHIVPRVTVRVVLGSVGST
jgi:hypothetical protein